MTRMGGTFDQSKPQPSAGQAASGTAGSADLGSSSTRKPATPGALASAAAFAGVPFTSAAGAWESAGKIDSRGGSAQLEPADRVQATSPEMAQRSQVRSVVTMFASLRGTCADPSSMHTRRARKPKRVFQRIIAGTFGDRI